MRLKVSKIRHSITVKAKSGKEYCFDVYINKKDLEQYWEEDLEIYGTINTFPEWVNELNLVRPWCFIQDIFNFKNPFSQK